MLYNFVQTGFKDILKNLIGIFVLIIVMSFVTLPIVSSLSSLIGLYSITDGVSQDDKDYYLELVPTNFDEIDAKLPDDLHNYYGQTATTFFESDFVSKTIGKIHFFFDGRSNEQFNHKSYIVTNGDINHFSSKLITDTQIIDSILKETDYSTEYHFPNVKLFELTDPQEVYEIYQHINKSEVIDIVYGTNHVKKASIDSLKEIFEHSFGTLKVSEWQDSNELQFLLRYIFIFNILSLIVLIFSIYYFYKEMFRKLRHEYRIHYIHGATVKDLLLRNLLHIALIIFTIFFLLSYLNGFSFDDRFYITLSITLIYCLVLVVSVIVFLRKIQKSIMER